MSEQAGSITNNKRNLIIMIAAFAAVYIIWGSTYLAIKYAIESIPTFIMAGMRFTIAGAFLMLMARMSPGYERPKLIHWRTSFIVGALLLVVGNGGVVMAEHYISSSMTALLVAVVPFFVVLLNWLLMGNERPNIKVALGLLIGFIGVWLLIGGGADAESTVSASGHLYGTVVLIIASFSWALGTLYGGRAQTSKSVIMAAGMQMTAGGLMMLLISAVTGEWTNFNVANVSSNSWIALAYLVIFGAIVAYTAYSWLMKHSTPAMVSTSSYVNPAIAVFLGWAIAGETLTGQMLLGAAIIVGSVALITSHKKTAKVVEPAKASETGVAPSTKESYST